MNRINYKLNFTWRATIQHRFPTLQGVNVSDLAAGPIVLQSDNGEKSGTHNYAKIYKSYTALRVIHVIGYDIKWKL